MQLQGKNVMWKLQTEDKIDESHKSQLRFEYDVYLLNYTMKIKNLTNKLGFWGYLNPNSTALAGTKYARAYTSS